MCGHTHARDQQPETDGRGGRDTHGSNEPAAPGSDKDGANPLPAEVWIVRAGGGTQKRFPAYATLTERVRHGNDLVGEREILLREQQYCCTPV